MKRFAILMTLGTFVLVLAFSPPALAGGGGDGTQPSSQPESSSLWGSIVDDLVGVARVAMGIDPLTDSSFKDDNGWDIHDMGEPEPSDGPNGYFVDPQTLNSSGSSDWGSSSSTQLEEQNASELDTPEFGGPLGP